MKISGYFFSILLILLGGQQIASQVILTEKDWVLPTYPVAEPDRNPIFFTGEAYQGASRHYYPLALNDQYLYKRVYQGWQTLILENEWIELAVTPEIGGKLYYATDKTNNYDFIYKNDVVKPSNIGMTGAWVSGGIEWCVLHHHRASTYLPLDYTTTENEDGSKTIWVGEYEPRHGMRWTIGVTVFPGKSYFKAEGRIHNPTPFTHTFLYWANVAAHTNENYQTIFPPSAQVVTFHSKTDFARWPVSHERFRGADFTSGVDISWWKNVVAHNSFFVHELQEDFMGGYDHGVNAGTVHIGDHNIVKGAKLWEWGSGPRGQATEARLTENAGPYVELMVGAYTDNQPDYSWIRPYEVKRWEQYWYPVRGIGGFKYANLNGAVNLEESRRNSIFLGYYSTQEKRARVILKKNDRIVFEKVVEISPAKPFAETVNLREAFDLYELHTALLDADTEEILIEYRPVKLDPVDELPEAWRGYPDPESLETVEELYLTGKRVEQFYAPMHDQMDYYREALRRDPGDIRTNTAVGNNYLMKGDYQAARRYFARAIKRLTMDYTRPSNCEALYLQGLTLKALGLYDEAVDTLYRATWDYAHHSAAYFQLAQISLMNGDIDRAFYQVNESLWTNARNNRAVALKASIQRRKGDYRGAIATLAPVLESDPLDFRARNEYYLATKDSGDHLKATAILSSLKKEMRDSHENYLDLAVGYINDGLLEEAEEVLLRFNGNYPISDYYLGYINHRLGETEQALKFFKAASDQPADYVFPHRLKTLEVMNTARHYNPGDGMSWYYTGNILYERQPVKAIESWENAVKSNPGLAIAFRNLGWGYYHHYGDGHRAIPYYEKAIALNNREAIYYAELDALYEMSNTPVETRLKLFDGNNHVVMGRDDAFIRQISVLTLAGQPQRAVEYLEGFVFPYREGSSRVRDIVIDAQLMMGKKYFDEGNHEKALKYFLEAQLPEEEAGSALFGNRNLQVNYYLGSVYEATGNKRQANSWFDLAAREEPAGRASSIMSYYRGLSLAKLGKHDQARETFERMIADALRQLEGEYSSEVGVIFGAREAENTRLSQAHTLRGLGYAGLGQSDRAKDDFEKAVELSHSNLWAKTALNGIRH
jgi:tetratricopeptide (TPR) repeat protein